MSFISSEKKNATYAKVNKNKLLFSQEIVPVSKGLDDQDSSKWVNDSVIITNEDQKYRLIFNFEIKPSPKYELVITPSTGEIKPGGNVVINIKLRVFCTTKIRSTVKIVFSPKETLISKAQFSVSPIILDVIVDSALSQRLDYDEIVVGKKIASGGYGTVFKAEWRGIDVALKQLHSQEMTEEESQLLKLELDLMEQMNCPYIISYIGCTLVQGQPICIIMEYIKEGSLTELLKKPISFKLKLKILLDIARGMAFLHSSNIYHQDLKPDNVLIASTNENSNPTAKITDFDTARALMRSHREGLNIEQLSIEEEKLKNFYSAGTVLYQAPEAMTGKISNPAKCDIFSFGILMWQVFMQIEPFSTSQYSDWSTFQIREFVMKGGRLEIPPEMHSTLTNLISACWNHNIEKRPPFSEIVKILVEFIESGAFPLATAEDKFNLSVVRSKLRTIQNLDRKINDLSSTQSLYKELCALEDYVMGSLRTSRTSSTFNPNEIEMLETVLAEVRAESKAMVEKLFPIKTDSSSQNSSSNSSSNSLGLPTSNFSSTSSSSNSINSVKSQPAIISKLNLESNVPSTHSEVLIGWQSEISRENAESLLSGAPLGTFLTRYSSRAGSYVISYVDKGNKYGHLANIFPQSNGSVLVSSHKEGSRSFNSFPEYINFMKSQKQIPITFPLTNKLPFSPISI